MTTLQVYSKFLLVCFSSFLLKKGAAFVNRQSVCCIQIIVSPACDSLLFSRDKEICGLQLKPEVFTSRRNYSVKQLQEFGNNMLQFKASSLNIPISKRNNTKWYFPTDQPKSSLEMCDCPPTEVKIFHKACSEGKLVEVKYILASHTTIIDCRGEIGRTALMKAVCKGHVKVVNLLKESGSNFNAIDDNNNNILHMACLGGHVDMVQYILSLHVLDMESKGYHRRTPLLQAVYKGHLPIVRLLKKSGANFKAVDKYNDNILHIACRGGHVDMVKYVLTLNGSDIEGRGFNGKTPLLTAVNEGHIPVVKHLKKRGANLKAVDKYNDNILYLACLSGHVDMVRYVLTSKSTELEFRGFNGRTPLLTAVYKGHIAIVNLLRERGANLKAVDKYNDNILHLACEGGHVDMVKYVLMLNGSDIEGRGFNGRTPLLTAVNEGHIPVVKHLKKRGANLKAVDKYNDNILRFACLGGHVDMVKYVLTLNGSDIEGRGFNGRTPLLTAVNNGHIPVVKLLKKRGANLKAVDKYNDNILHLACVGGHVDMVKYVISLNITDLESRGKYGRTALMKAVYMGYIPVVKLLHQRYGARLLAVDDLRFNVLHMACEKGQVEMVKYLATLKELSGLKRRENSKGQTPLDVAKQKGYQKVLALLQAEE